MEYILTEGSGIDKVVDNLLKKDELAFDTETNTTKVKGRNKDFKCVSVIISSKNNSYYIPINHRFYNKNMSEDYFLDKFAKIFTNSNIKLIGHNINFDFHVLERLGIKPQRNNYYDTLLASRMVNEEYDNKLEHILEKYLDVKGLHGYDEIVGNVSKERKLKAGLKSNNKATFDLVKVKEAAIYGIEDTNYLIKLKDVLTRELKEKNLYNIYKNLIVPSFSNVFYSMEKKGIDIDKKELKKIDKEITKDTNKTIKEMEDLIDIEINPNSPKQISELLYNEYTSDPPCDICKEEICEEKCDTYKIWEKYGHKNPNIGIREKSFKFPIPERTDSGQPSSGKSSLKRFIHYEPKNEWQEVGLEFIDLLLHYKKVSKLKTSFVDGLKDSLYDDERVHPSFNALAAKSGRASSSNINAQQLPDQDEEDKYKIRKMFKPDKGYIMVASDYDNLEMKLLAHFSGDDKLLKTFKEGHDSHGATAVNVLGLDCHPDEAKKLYPTERNIGKTLNFALMYGMSPHTLYYTLMDFGVDLEDKDLQSEYNAYSGQDLAKTIYKRYFESYKGVEDLIDKQIKRARKNEYVKSILGRKIWIPEINSKQDKYRSYGERLATNGKIQSSSSDVIMQAQVNIENSKELNRLGVQQLMQVHDEIVLQVPKKNLEESLKYINKEMENPFKEKVDTLVDLTVSMDTGKNYFEAK